MPTYEYECGVCGHVFDVLLFVQKKVTCPNCKSKEVEKRITAPAGFQFKGDGFYSTDSKKGE